ncbi:hypothetical protein N657DRAFT_568700 [Parathielavia appendiculata]|uniref:Ubiquitin carrier protein n=1 Tax=Parathielavia appendiculata TaxID=2587402 RepID=A0AAN6Z6M8_9PEZI|nr:hypothetical protein N657DRAFT_568700 [Parathielavia appendiculata]
MYSSVTLGHSLAKRLVEYPSQGTSQWVEDNVSAAALFIFVVDFILFVPVLVFIAYTLGFLYPTLAAVEDPLPAYDALSMNEDGAPTKDDDDRIRTAQPGKPITSSLRAIYRLVRSQGSWRSNLRGLGYKVVVGLLAGSTTLFLSAAPFVSPSIAQLLALLAVAPLYTAWTHFVVTPPHAKSFFSRIPPVRKVYLATWFPTFLFWAANHAAVVLPMLLASVIGLQLPDPNQPADNQTPMTGSDAAKAICVLGVHLALTALLVTPAHVALARVQASLLPADEDTLVPFDRSFGGRVEPEIVSGKGFATFGAALKTVSVQSWVRIYLLDIKVAAVAVAAYAVMGAVVVGQVLLFGLWAGSQ